MATPKSPKQPKKAVSKPAIGEKPKKQNNPGKVVEKGSPAPEKPKVRPDVKNTHEYLDSVKKEDIPSEGKRLSQELKTASDNKDYVRATQLKDAMAGLKDKGVQFGLKAADLVSLDDSTALRISEAFEGAFGSNTARLQKGFSTAKSMLKPKPGDKPKEAAPAPTKPVAAAQPGGHVMKRNKVKCFKAGDKTKNKTDEYDRQLADQEKGINDMTVQEYLDGRKAFTPGARDAATKAAQQSTRTDYASKLTQSNLDTLNKQGIFGAAASQQAAQMTASKMDTLAALHNPDGIMGGTNKGMTMGDKGVNSSIGTQWKTKAGDLDNAAKEVPEDQRKTTKMNVKLKRCK